jgi:cytochrome c oxidase subunit 2
MVARTMGAAAVALLAGCGGPASALHPRGLGAERIATLWWLLFAIGISVYLLVLGTTLWAVRHRRSPPREVREFWPRIAVVAGGMVLPHYRLTVA